VVRIARSVLEIATKQWHFPCLLPKGLSDTSIDLVWIKQDHVLRFPLQLISPPIPGSIGARANL